MSERKLQVITGGTSGMGLATAKALSEYGPVLIGGRSEKRLENALAELKAAHPSVLKEDYQVWESVCSEYGLKLLKNSSLLNGSGLENITVSYYPPLSEIPADYSYVTIVHFADGTVVMSDVKQK